MSGHSDDVSGHSDDAIAGVKAGDSPPTISVFEEHHEGRVNPRIKEQIKLIRQLNRPGLVSVGSIKATLEQASCRRGEEYLPRSRRKKAPEECKAAGISLSTARKWLPKMIADRVLLDAERLFCWNRRESACRVGSGSVRRWLSPRGQIHRYSTTTNTHTQPTNMTTVFPKPWARIHFPKNGFARLQCFRTPRSCGDMIFRLRRECRQ